MIIIFKYYNQEKAPLYLFKRITKVFNEFSRLFNIRQNSPPVNKCKFVIFFYVILFGACYFQTTETNLYGQRVNIS